jgi:hypothetical protein
MCSFVSFVVHYKARSRRLQSVLIRFVRFVRSPILLMRKNSTETAFIFISGLCLTAMAGTPTKAKK